MQTKRTVVTTNMGVLRDAALNDSDKTIVVPVGRRYHVFGIYVTLISDATVGNRQLRVDFRDGAIIDAQDESSYDNSPTAEGTFAGGTGHEATDVITLIDGSTVTVDAVSGGVVTQFTVATAGTRIMPTFADSTVLTQSSTDGSGTGFSLSPGAANLGNVFCHVLAGATQAASLTYNYSVAPGLPHLTSVIGTELMTPMPATMVLEAGMQIRIYDSTAVAAGGDDMTYTVLVDDNVLRVASPGPV